MNSTQRMVLDALQLGAMPAVDLLGALRLRGRQLTIEGLYLELVSLEARQHVRVEGVYDGCGNRTGGAWALGHMQAPQAPEYEPEERPVARALRLLSTPADQPAEPARAGVLIHRCL